MLTQYLSFPFQILLLLLFPLITFLPQCIPLPALFLSFNLYHTPVAQGRVWALPQVNPSSDNSRFIRGRGGLEQKALRQSSSDQPQHLRSHHDPQEQLNHEPQNLQQTQDQVEFCSQCSLPSGPQPEPENDHQTHDQANLHHLHQHGLSPIPLHLQQPPPSFSESVFRGSDLVHWLVERGLSAGRAEAELYCVRLQQGGVIDHLGGKGSSVGEPNLLYCFTEGREREGERMNCPITCWKKWGGSGSHLLKELKPKQKCLVAGKEMIRLKILH